MSNPEYNIDPTLDRLLRTVTTAIDTESQNSIYEPVDIPPARPNDRRMTDFTRQELDAKLETVEARMDGRVAAIQASIDGFVGRMEERSLRTDERFARIEEGQRDTQASLGSLKTTIITTAIATVLTIVLGVAAFNSTVLSSMTSSFEAGKNTIISQAELKKQAEDTAALLKQAQNELDQARRSRDARPDPEK
jgi:hypothetical protein